MKGFTNINVEHTISHLTTAAAPLVGQEGLLLLTFMIIFLELF